jgi:hypothetical protein
MLGAKVFESSTEATDAISELLYGSPRLEKSYGSVLIVLVSCQQLRDMGTEKIGGSGGGGGDGDGGGGDGDGGVGGDGDGGGCGGGGDGGGGGTNTMMSVYFHPAVV